MHSAFFNTKGIRKLMDEPNLIYVDKQEDYIKNSIFVSFLF